MLDNFVEGLKQFNSNLDAIIAQFLKNYIPGEEPPFFTARMAIFIKTVFYFLLFLLPFTFLKLFYPYNTKLTLLIIFILIVMGISILGIIFGFIQLAFSF